MEMTLRIFGNNGHILTKRQITTDCNYSKPNRTESMGFWITLEIFLWRSFVIAVLIKDVHEFIKKQVSRKTIVAVLFYGRTDGRTYGWCRSSFTPLNIPSVKGKLLFSEILIYPSFLFRKVLFVLSLVQANPHSKGCKAVVLRVVKYFQKMLPQSEIFLSTFYDEILRHKTKNVFITNEKLQSLVFGKIKLFSKTFSIVPHYLA